tara:strand:+ start:1005 stop:2105 length:1101 start_codon:yes stop_codon:yes gene_type:complete
VGALDLGGGLMAARSSASGEAPVFAVADQFRRQVAAGEAIVGDQLLAQYARIEGELRPRIVALLTDALDRDLTKGEITRLWRARGLEAEVLDALDEYSGFAGRTIAGGQAEAVQLARDHARRIVSAGLPPGIDVAVLEAGGVAWNQIPDEALINLIGRLGDGSPLRSLLDEIGPGVTARVQQELATAVVTGTGPRVAGQRLRNVFGEGLSRALMVSRTEILRSYREGNRAQWLANPSVVRRWERRSARNERTCMACVALDGTIYEVEDPGDFHINDRCSMIPITLTYREMGLDVDETPRSSISSRDWFAAQPEATQRKMMGNRAFDAWTDGDIGFEDFVHTERSTQWGDASGVATLKQMGIGKQAP